MKIFIYKNLIENQVITDHNKKLANANSLHQHLEYLHDFYNIFKNLETKNPDEADYFFIPLFLTGWQFANHDPEELINSCKYINRGRHLLMATGDFGQRKESIYEMNVNTNPIRAYANKYLWLDDRFELILLESVKHNYRNDIAFMPYPTRKIDHKDVERDILISFMGKITQPFLPEINIRNKKFEEFKNFVKETSCFLIGTNEEIKAKLSKDVTPDELMSRSVFTLCPPGYGRWTFRFIEALNNGSIPILLCDDYELPFSDYINWRRYCVILNESDLFDVQRIISEMSITDIYEKLQNIKKDSFLFKKDYSIGKVVDSLSTNTNKRFENKTPKEVAIYNMRSPSEMEIICIDITNKCDLACSNCTRLLENQDEFWEMSEDNFRNALRSLKNFKGIIAMIGGNPCMHTKFKELCNIFKEEIPNQLQRGLWTNNVFKYTDLVEETFGGLNLNTHNMVRSVDKLKSIYENMVLKGGFNGGLYLENSEHAPILTAVKDLYSEKEMWEKISGCDINREWSATIVENKGKLRAYFCEVAASFDLARNEDNGLEVVEDWWNRPISDFSNQIEKFCPGCGVPARIKGHFDYENTDTYSISNQDIAIKSANSKKRKIIFMQTEKLQNLTHKVTKYSSNSK